jgi:hypothetical protein
LGFKKHTPFLHKPWLQKNVGGSSTTQSLGLHCKDINISLRSLLLNGSRNLQKTSKNGSVIWKATVNAFPLIGNWLIWKVGNGVDIIIGKDPWIEFQGKHILPKPIIQDLNNAGFFHLQQITRRDMFWALPNG